MILISWNVTNEEMQRRTLPIVECAGGTGYEDSQIQFGRTLEVEILRSMLDKGTVDILYYSLINFSDLLLTKDRSLDNCMATLALLFMVCFSERSKIFIRMSIYF